MAPRPLRKSRQHVVIVSFFCGKIRRCFYSLVILSTLVCLASYYRSRYLSLNETLPPTTPLSLEGLSFHPPSKIRSTTWSTKESTEHLAIFYNIFIPDRGQGDRTIPNAIRIVREQIQQIGKSYAASTPSQNTTVYYNTIDAHYARGFEQITLKELYRYCQTHETHIVVYLHNKGSYNPSQKQEHWRRHGTMAATSEHCLRPSNDTCNVCGLYWNPLPWPHFPGNFWSAKCSYIRRLVPPQSYRIRKRGFIENVERPLQKQGLIQFRLFGENHISIAGKRFSMEQWIGSHPSVMPCDLSQAFSIGYWRVQGRNASEFQRAKAPRHGFRKMLSVSTSHRAAVIDRDMDRLRDYNLLAGSILRWAALYRELPSSKSWVWSFFPDGDLWRGAVEKYGDRAVQVLTKTCLEARRRCLEAANKTVQSPYSAIV